MIRVLQVIGKMDRAGAETLIMNLYRSIDRTKVQFDFLVFADKEADYDEEILDLGGKIYRMPPFNGINYWLVCMKMKKFFDEHPYQIVHGHLGSLAPAYLKMAKKKGAYAIAHSHAPDSNILIEKVLHKFFAYNVRYVADYFFACSKRAGEDRFGRKIVEGDSFKVVNNGIDSERYIFTDKRHDQLKNKYHLHDYTIYGHVGRFVEVKNHVFLIEIFESILKKDENARLILIGRGPEEQKIRQIVQDKGLDNRVLFWGMRSDIDDMMNLFDAFIFPSYYEGLPVSSVEAQAAGLPCFFSTGVSEEAAITGNVWRISLEERPDVWADQILDTLQRYERHDTQKEIIIGGFDIKEIAAEMQEFYLQHVGKENINTVKPD